ncbi:MAG: SDR family oxidoreductase [Muribaculaceae bacterium]|nr:SDR family oxidoreductase [Muribaculaceae bacterium]
MADNYLERKMEEYRSGKLAKGNQNKRKSSTLFPATGYDLNLISAQRVVIIGDCISGKGRELLKLFRSLGCRVAFCDKNMKEGNALAQQTGARFYPFDYDDLERVEKMRSDVSAYWGGVDICVQL